METFNEPVQHNSVTVGRGTCEKHYLDLRSSTPLQSLEVGIKEVLGDKLVAVILLDCKESTNVDLEYAETEISQ
jgi:hypothetical protein